MSPTQLNATANTAGGFAYREAIGTILPAGNGQILSTTFTPTDAVNYVGVTASTVINVAKARPVISWSDPLDIVYGTVLSATQLNATANTAGAFAYREVAGTLLSAGSGQILSATFTPADSANYTGRSASVTINVMKARPIITWEDPADIIYGTALSETQLNASANIEGVITYDETKGTILTAGNGQILSATFAPTDSANYTGASANVTINVAKARPVITWDDPADIIYGTPLTDTQLNASANVAGGIAYSQGPGTTLPAGSGQILSATFTPTDGINYARTTATVVLNVLKARPVITWTDPTDIIYGTALGGDQLNAIANIGGNFTYEIPLGAVLSAGSGQLLSVRFTPNDVANFTAATASVAINVIKARPVITWGNPSDIVYGTPLSGTQLNATANVAGTFAYESAAGAVFPAGARQVLAVMFIPSDGRNYTSASATIEINVAKAQPVISWSDPADIENGTPLGGAQLNATANVPGTFAYTPPVGSILAVGVAQSLATVFTPADIGNYLTANKTVRINVLQPAAPPEFIVEATAGATSGKFEFVLKASAGSAFVIEESVDMTRWTEFETSNIPENGIYRATVIVETQGRRFYRASVRPPGQ